MMSIFYSLLLKITNIKPYNIIPSPIESLLIHPKLYHDQY